MHRVSRFSVLCLFAAPAVFAQPGDRRLAATLSGYEEVVPVATPAKGAFRAVVNAQQNSFTYELEYSGLSSPVVMAHIHFAQRGVNGSVVVWLCGTAAAPGPQGTPVCPASGKVTGTAAAAQVGGTTQGIAQGEFTKLLAALRAGVTYANVHTTAFPAGEIRGQIDDRAPAVRIRLRDGEESEDGDGGKKEDRD